MATAIKSFTKVLLCLTVSVFFIFCKKKEDLFVPVTGKIVDKTTKLPVENARVVYNAVQTVNTDQHGEFRVEYNLRRFLADSISFYITKENYVDKNYSGIVGNTQRDIFVIELEPR